MKILVFILALAVIAPASATTHRTNTATISTYLGSRPQVLHTAAVVPDVASATVYVYVNGKTLPYGGSDSPRIVERAGRGVIAVVSVAKKTAPGAVRLASVRSDVVRVRVVFTWR